MPAWILVISWITKLILVLLIGLSVWSIAIMLDRLKALRRQEDSSLDEVLGLVRSNDDKALAAWAAKGEDMKSGVVRVALSADSKSSESIDRAVRSFLVQERAKLEKGLTVLGSLGSNAPFIGLFGTVLGVIQAFGALAFEQGNMSVVMASIAEALVATAAGLFVAIPAVVAYNYFARRLRLILNDCEAIRDLYVSVKHGR